MKTFLMAAMLVAAAAAGAQEMPLPRGGPGEHPVPETVSVSGMGHAHLTPDRYSFTVGVQTVAPTVDDAVGENNRQMAAVTAALRKAGAAENEIRTANFSINPQQDYTQGKLPRILGYEVSNTLTVTRANLGDAGKLLQAAVSAGVNTSSGLQFEVSDPTRGRDAGLRAAFDDARDKAAALAQAAGRNLGPALVITEGGAAPPRVFARAAMGIAGGAAPAEVPVESGTQELTFTVSVTFGLR